MPFIRLHHNPQTISSNSRTTDSQSLKQCRRGVGRCIPRKSGVSFYPVFSFPVKIHMITAKLVISGKMYHASRKTKRTKCKL